MKKKLILLSPIATILAGCAFDLSLGAGRSEAPPVSELSQVRAELAVAKENIRNLEEQRLATLGDLEKARADIAALQQRMIDLASAMKSRESSDTPKP